MKLLLTQYLYLIFTVENMYNTCNKLQKATHYFVLIVYTHFKIKSQFLFLTLNLNFSIMFFHFKVFFYEFVEKNTVINLHSKYF